MKIIEYKFKGTRRRIGAIGEPEKFTISVSRQSGTLTPKDAMDTARKSMYDDGWEHILFTSCKMIREIPMLEALGLK